MSTRRAGIYVRISADRTGKGLGVARQEKACRQKAQERGWTVAQVFSDNDVSASTGKRRPGYEAMLQAVGAGTIDAVIVWDLDRLTRRPIEIEQFIDLADRHGLSLASVGGDVDLSTDNGRMFARIKGAVARAEVERKSARQKASNDQKAEDGRPFMGRRAFGYQRGGMAVNEAEARHFRYAVERLLEGAAIRTIAREINAHGATTTAGNPWKSTELRRLLSNPRHAGLRVHRGDVVGPGVWPAIVDEDTHRAVCAILSDPSRQPKGRPRTYLLSGVGRCGACSARVYGRTERRGALYVCENKPHLGPKVEPIDNYVSAVMMGRLSRPDAAEVFAAPDNSARLAELQREARVITGRLDGLAEAFAAGDIDRRQLTAGTSRLRRRMDEIEQETPALAVTPKVAPLLGATSVQIAWDALTTEARRGIIDALATITVHPPGRGARLFDPNTVVVEWKS